MNLSQDEVNLFKKLEEEDFEEPSKFYNNLVSSNKLPSQFRDLFKSFEEGTSSTTSLEKQFSYWAVPRSMIGDFRGLYSQLVGYRYTKTKSGYRKIKIKPTLTVGLVDISDYLDLIDSIRELTKKLGISITTLISRYKKWLVSREFWRVFEFRFYAVRKHSILASPEGYKIGKHTPDRQLEVVLTTQGLFNDKKTISKKALDVIVFFLKRVKYDFLLNYSSEWREERNETLVETARTVHSENVEEWEIKYGYRWLDEIDEPDRATFNIKMIDYQYNLIRYRSVFTKPKYWWELSDSKLKSNVYSHTKSMRENIPDVVRVHEEVNRQEWLGQTTLATFM